MSPEKGKEGMAGRPANLLVVPTDPVRKVDARPILTAEENPPGDSVVPEAERGHIEYRDIHRQTQGPAQFLGEGDLILERGPPRPAAVVQVHRYVDIPESVSVDERTVKIGEENLFAKVQEVPQGGGDAGLFPRG
jgi:hypothetical protein